MFRLDYLLIADYSLLQVKRKLGVKKIYTLAIALMSGVILTACVGAVNVPTNTANDVDPEAAIIGRCIMEDLATDASCAPIVKKHPCILNPFGGACDVAFPDYYKLVQTNRISFCRKNDNDNLCADAIENVCGNNPFDGLCGSYETARTKIIGYCSDGKTMDNNRCPQFVSNCLLKPFSAGCSHNSFQDRRESRIRFCGVLANKDNPTCAVILSRVTTASFLQSFDEPLPTTAGELENQFVQGTATGLDLDNANNQDLRTPTFHTLNLATGHGSQNLGGDITDGVALFRHITPSTHRLRSRNRNHYVGILSGTDLGLPLTTETSSGIWNGGFYVFGNSIDSVSYDFILTVNFGAGVQAGTITASVDRYSLTGNFDSNGVIKGDVEFSLGDNVYSADLRGLIGEQGAVGVFIGDRIDGLGYAGGFVARPLSN